MIPKTKPTAARQNAGGGRLSPGERTDLLARMLCYGVRPIGIAPAELREHHGLDSGFIQGSVLMLENRWPVNTAFLDTMVEAPASVPLEYKDGVWHLAYGGRTIECPPMRQPTQLFSQIDYRGTAMGLGVDYVRLHSPQTVFCTPLRQCIFGAIGKGCAFCTFEMSAPRPLPDELVFHLLEIAFAQDPQPTDLAFGGGTPNLRDHGTRYYARLAAMARGLSPAISVELVPPPVIDDLQILAEQGVGSVIMSIEVWDDDIRRRVCPGKSVESKADYQRAWETAVRIFGASQVSSVLLVGLESEESTRAGIDALVNQGVVPTLIPFRPYDSSAMRTHPPTDHRQYLRCSIHCVNRLRALGMSPLLQGGCTKCGGCSLEVYGLGDEFDTGSANQEDRRPSLARGGGRRRPVTGTSA